MNGWQKRRLLQDRRRERRNGGGALRLVLAGLLGIASLGAICAAAGLGAMFYVYQSYAKDYVPIEEKLRQQNVGLTEIYDRNGELLGALPNQDAQLLSPVPLDEISPWVIEATVSTEDNSFFENPGINLKGLTRAGIEYLQGGIDAGTGGSSITQQLIKNVYICPSINTPDDPTRCVTAERTITRKLREIIYALELSQDETKDDILTWYLNQISYADRYIGIQAAAEGYFHKDAKDLSLAEAALLAGVPQYPTLYHPRLNCVSDAETGKCVYDELNRTTLNGPAKARQEDVLDLMFEHGRITAAQLAEAKAEVVKVYAATNTIKAGAFIDNQVQPRLVRMCEAGYLPKLEGTANCEDSVSSAGYDVVTTLDWAETQQATTLMREFIATGIDLGCECHNAAIVTIEPSSGQIVVYAPNIDPSNTTDPEIAGTIDQLTEINQPGSSFKPAVYLAWFDTQNKAPLSVFWDTSPLTVGGVAITNPRTGGSSEGLITARAGLGGSQNVPAFRAATEAGVDNVIMIAKALGITTLEQNFDPTYYSHEDVQYGASIATGGANIRAVDMAYMDATIANMGTMIGVPTLAREMDMDALRHTKDTEGADYDTARRQARDFALGHTRLPGTRDLDPVVVLQVKGPNGEIVYDHEQAGDLQAIQKVNAGSVWLLHSIMSDCNARFIIWGCGNANDDLRLDAFMLDGQAIPTGIKTGTQQGPLSASDTLETWMTGYSRYAATAVWVGNATNALVNDRQFAAANTTTKLWKTWMGTYHSYLQGKGMFETPVGFADLQPGNVAQVGFSTPTTDRVFGGGGCDQVVTGWVRTDVTYESQCESAEVDSRNGLLATDETPSQYRVTRKFVKLPVLGRDLAIALAESRGIPIVPTERSTGQAAVSISSPTNGRTVSGKNSVVGAVTAGGTRSWKLEMGAGSNPGNWTTIGSGSGPTDGILGEFDATTLEPGVYTIRLTAESTSAGNLSTSVQVNVRGSTTPGSPTASPSPGGGTGNGNGDGNGNTPTATRTQIPDTIPVTPTPPIAQN